MRSKIKCFENQILLPHLNPPPWGGLFEFLKILRNVLHPPLGERDGEGLSN